ncbi:Contactin-3 [Liparis tanakae]|uniref:Contactin-3 n=1 Tax=Liparis tanakae TaxID=230148 RepID=A0A4Z2GS25_9TELE|nr:Contactin-3 [Liparis tanakae]
MGRACTEDVIFQGPRWRTEPSDLILPINSPDQQATVACGAEGSPPPQYRRKRQVSQCCGAIPSLFDVESSCKIDVNLKVTGSSFGACSDQPAPRSTPQHTALFSRSLLDSLYKLLCP